MIIKAPSNIFDTSKQQSISYSSDITITPVTNSTSFKEFYQFPYSIYQKYPQWTPPLFKEYDAFFKKKNSFWTHATTQLYLAKKGDISVGRIGVFYDKLFIKTYSESIGFFGFFESINDKKVSSALLATAQTWLQKKNCKKMVGPLNGRIDIGCGLLIDGFQQPPSFQASYNPPYYEQLVENFGLKKNRDLLDYYIDLKKPLPIKLQKKAEHCQKKGIILRSFNRWKAHRELEWWVDLFMETFQDHWGYVPAAKDEVLSRFGIKQLRWFVDSQLFLVAEYQSKPVAYIWAMPEYNQLFKRFNGKLGLGEIFSFLLKRRTISEGKLYLIGIKKKWRTQYVASFLNYTVLYEMQKRGYHGAVCGWLDEHNSGAHHTIALTDPSVYKRYRIYEKLI